jgi:Cu/Ag efflux pump CusA
LQDWILAREFRRLPGVCDVSRSGGVVKRYEIHPDPDRRRRYGITLRQLSDALANSNANVGDVVLPQGPVALNVRAIGLFGGGTDSLSAEVLNATDPVKAAYLLRAEENRRLGEIRKLVITSVNDRPICIEDVVEGGRLAPGDLPGLRGVIAGNRPRVGRVGSAGPGRTEDTDTVQGVVQMRPGEDLRLLQGVRARIRELNTTAGKLLPGVRIEPYHASAADGEGVVWVYGTFPANASLEATAQQARKVVELLLEFPEVARVVSQVGMPEDGPPQSPNQLQLFVGLKTDPDIPVAPGRDRPRTRTELLGEFSSLLSARVPGVSWLTTTTSPEELELAFPGAPAEHLLKVFGPDFEALDRLADPVQAALRTVPGVENVVAYRSLGLPQMDFRIDFDKCSRWGVRVADVSAVLQAALGGKAVSQMVEGEKTFDIVVRWPQQMRGSEAAILDLPIDVTNNQVDPASPPDGPIKVAPRLRLRDLISPVGKGGESEPRGDFVRPGIAVIYREQGKRLLPVRFSVRGRPLADVQAEAATKIAPLLKAPYRIEWSD